MIADHIERVGGVVQSQRQSQVGVGPDVVADDTARTLRRQDQVHAKATATLSDAHESVKEVRLLADECGELVDDDNKAGQSASGGADLR